MSDAPSRGRTVMARGEYLAVSYDPAKVPFGPYPGRLARHLHQEYYRTPGRLLDAGCGRGEYLTAFAALGHSVAGVDVSPEAPNFAPGLDIQVVDLEFSTLPYSRGSFDYVFSKSVVEHLRSPDHFLSELRASLRPGGLAVIMTPSWLHTYWGPFYVDHTHVTPFTAPSLVQAMQLAGFAEVKCEHFYQLPAVWRVPALKLLCRLLAMLPLPYRPMHPAGWPDGLNKVIRFSNEVMLLAVGRNPAQE